MRPDRFADHVRGNDVPPLANEEAQQLPGALLEPVAGDRPLRTLDPQRAHCEDAMDLGGAPTAGKHFRVVAPAGIERRGHDGTAGAGLAFAAAVACLRFLLDSERG